MVAIPKNLQGVFWSRDVSCLDVVKDKHYIIHQVLMFGSLPHFEWLKSVYSMKEIRKVFITSPQKIYTPQAFHFIKSYLLGIHKDLEESAYVKTAL